MSFQIPSFNRKTKILLVQLGSPENPSVSAVRKYLKNFLGDPRVVDINPWIWKFILNDKVRHLHCLEKLVRFILIFLHKTFSSD